MQISHQAVKNINLPFFNVFLINGRVTKPEEPQ